MTEFRKYGPAPAVEKDPPMCVVTYPEPCGRSAVGEVWALPFCEAHGEEAHLAARLEAYEDAGRELDALRGLVEGERAVRNPLVYEVLRGAKFPPRPYVDQGEAVRTAYDLAAAETDPETLRHDYDVQCDTPYDWWCETREMVVGFMREAFDANQPHLVAALEPIREHASVQQELAFRDMNGRWAQPRRAAREEARKRTEAAGRAPAEILAATNGALSSAVDLLDDVPPEAFGDEEDYWRAKRAISEAGGLVVAAEGRSGDRPA